jgi:raffinose/stachyose/melibiose transport system permease protein
MLLAGLIFIFPFYLLLINSFKTYPEIMISFIDWPGSLYLDNFKQAYKLMNYPRVFSNSVLITVMTVAGTILVSFLAAYGLQRNQNKLSQMLYFFFVAGLLIPFHSIMIPIAQLTKTFQLADHYIALIAIYIALNCSFGILVYFGFLKSVPNEINESALMDGCGIWTLLFRIIFPLLMPATTTLVILFSMWTWNDFLLPMLLISSAEWRTITLNQYIFSGGTQVEWNLFIASLILSIAPIIVIYLICQRYIVDGLTSGAVK